MSAAIVDASEVLVPLDSGKISVPPGYLFLNMMCMYFKISVQLDSAMLFDVLIILFFVCFFV